MARNDHRVVPFREVVRQGKGEHGHERGLALCEVEFGGHSFRNDGRQAHVCAEPVHGFDEDGRWNDPRYTARKDDPRVHGLNLKVRGVVHRERHDHRTFSTVMGARDGQFVLAAAEVHRVHNHRTEVVDGQLLVVVHQRGVLRVHRGADVHRAVEFIEPDHIHPCCKRQTELGDVIGHAGQDGEIGCGPIVVAFTSSEGLDAVGRHLVAVHVKGLRTEVSVVEGECAGVGEGDVKHGAAAHQDLHGQRATAFSGFAPNLAFGQWEVEFVHPVGVGEVHLHRR